MSEQTWKLEKDLCRCCHSEGSYRNLSESFTNDSKEEVLADMLQFTLDVNISPVPGDLCFVTYTVCDECIERIRDATNFKRQVLQCEQRFHTMYDNDLIKVPIVEGDFTVKDETPDRDTGDIISDIHHMDSDDDFPMNCDDEDLKSDTETREETRKSKGKKTKSKESKAKKKPDRPKKKATGRVSNVKNSDAKKDYKVVRAGKIIKYYCKFCNIELTCRRTMEEHIIVFHEDDYKCPLCHVIAKTIEQKHAHMARKHGVAEEFDETGKVILVSQMYECDICYKTYKLKEKLAWHMGQHKPLKCRWCSKRFERTDLPRHVREVHGDMSLTCGVCGYEWYKSYLVLLHQRNVHMNEKNVECDVCHKMFSDKRYLKQHLIRHNPVKKFECAHCQKKFPRRTTLVQHLKIHMGIKKKVCEICKQKFVQKASLNYHMMKYHPAAVY